MRALLGRWLWPRPWGVGTVCAFRAGWAAPCRRGVVRDTRSAGARPAEGVPCRHRWQVCPHHLGLRGDVRSRRRCQSLGRASVLYHLMWFNSHRTLRLRCIICSLQIWTLREKLTSMSNSTWGFEGRLTSLQICTVSAAPLWLQGFLRGTQLVTCQRPSGAWSSAVHSGTSVTLSWRHRAGLLTWLRTFTDLGRILQNKKSSRELHRINVPGRERERKNLTASGLPSA